METFPFTKSKISFVPLGGRFKSVAVDPKVANSALNIRATYANILVKYLLFLVSVLKYILWQLTVTFLAIQIGKLTLNLFLMRF